MSEPLDNVSEDAASALPTLVVPEEGLTGESGGSTPRSVSPSRSTTPPVDTDSQSTSSSDVASVSSKKRGSHTRSGHTRRHSKPREEPIEEMVDSVKTKAESASSIDPKGPTKAVPLKPIPLKAASASIPPQNADRSSKDPKKPVTPRNGSSPTSAASVAPKGMFFYFSRPYHTSLVHFYHYHR